MGCGGAGGVRCEGGVLGAGGGVWEARKESPGERQRAPGPAGAERRGAGSPRRNRMRRPLAGAPSRFAYIRSNLLRPGSSESSRPGNPLMLCFPLASCCAARSCLASAVLEVAGQRPRHPALAPAQLPATSPVSPSPLVVEPPAPGIPHVAQRPLQYPDGGRRPLAAMSLLERGRDDPLGAPVDVDRVAPA